MEIDDAGGASTTRAPTYQAGFESGTGIRPPDPSAETEGQADAPSAPSGSDVHMNSTLLQPVSSCDVAVFEPRTRRGPRLDVRLFIYCAPAALCLDHCGTALIKMYMHKVSGAAKWRVNWDRMTDRERGERAKVDHQRRGHGTVSWIYGKDVVPPTFKPKKHPDIEKQIADLLEYANDVCYLPDTYWLNETAKQVSGAKPKVEETKDAYTLDMANDSDPCLVMVLRLVLSLYNKPYCSFMMPRREEQRRDDCFYFPENSAFLDVKRVSGLVAAVMMCSDPQADLGDKPMENGRKWLAANPSMICDASQPEGFLAILQQRIIPRSSALRSLMIAAPDETAILPERQEDQELDQMD